VRLKSVRARSTLLLAAILLAPLSFAAAQDSAILMPEQSAAKAKQLLQQTIEDMGGSAFLNVRDMTCTGRYSQFGHSGEMEGFEQFQDYVEPPNMSRTENLPQRNIVEVYNGDKGWTLDRGGVAEAPTADLIRFQEGVKKDIGNILRNRIHEPGMSFRYAGIDIVDLHEVDWVELTDSEDRTLRIAIDRSSHLPIRRDVEQRNPDTRVTTKETDLYSNYHPINGVQTPFQIQRDRNGMKVYQVFFDSCQYNTGLPASLFTRESLDDRWQKIGKKEREKEKKHEKKEEKDTASSN
jgi:outer membrane lipoprotein-sorting protein